VCSWRDSHKIRLDHNFFPSISNFLHRTSLDATIALRNPTQIPICRFAEDLAGAEVVHLLQEAEVASVLVEVSPSVLQDFEKELICCSGRGSFQQQSYGPPATVLGMEYLELLF
jgi:hypothetical protein